MIILPTKFQNPSYNILNYHQENLHINTANVTNYLKSIFDALKD